MVAALRTNDRDPQLPFQVPPRSPSFTYSRTKPGALVRRPSRPLPVQVQSSPTPRVVPPTTVNAWTAPSSALAPSHPTQTVVPFVKPSSQPQRLQRLAIAQRGVCLMTVTLVGLALGLYGQSVYQQRQWGQAYERLEDLKKIEQQGMTFNEVMKNNLAEQAEQPGSSMQPRVPGATIPVEKMVPRDLNLIAPSTPALDLELGGPIGY